MRALSLTQPWAWSMVHGPKRVENRRWPAEYMVGKRFAMHASMKWDKDGEAFLRKLGVEFPSRDRCVFGAIIGVASMVRCVSHDELDWAFSTVEDDEHRTVPPWAGKRRSDVIPPDQERFFFGPFGFVLDNVVPITPIVHPGALSFFYLPDHVTELVEERVGRPVDTMPPPVIKQQDMWEPPGGLVRRPDRPASSLRKRRR